MKYHRVELTGSFMIALEIGIKTYHNFSLPQDGKNQNYIWEKEQ